MIKLIKGFILINFMETSLITILRNCSPGQRRFYSQELAKTGSDWGVLELIRMAEGEVRKRGLFSCIGNIHYNEDEQVLAISALGESKNKIAYDYLRGIYDKWKEGDQTLLNNGRYYGIFNEAISRLEKDLIDFQV